MNIKKLLLTYLYLILTQCLCLIKNYFFNNFLLKSCHKLYYFMVLGILVPCSTDYYLLLFIFLIIIFTIFFEVSYKFFFNNISLDYLTKWSFFQKIFNDKILFYFCLIISLMFAYSQNFLLFNDLVILYYIFFLSKFNFRYIIDINLTNIIISIKKFLNWVFHFGIRKILFQLPKLFRNLFHKFFLKKKEAFRRRIKKKARLKQIFGKETKTIDDFFYYLMFFGELPVYLKKKNSFFMIFFEKFDIFFEKLEDFLNILFFLKIFFQGFRYEDYKKFCNYFCVYILKHNFGVFRKRINSSFHVYLLSKNIQNLSYKNLSQIYGIYYANYMNLLNNKININFYIWIRRVEYINMFMHYYYFIKLNLLQLIPLFKFYFFIDNFYKNYLLPFFFRYFLLDLYDEEDLIIEDVKDINKSEFNKEISLPKIIITQKYNEVQFNSLNNRVSVSNHINYIFNSWITLTDILQMFLLVLFFIFMNFLANFFFFYCHLLLFYTLIYFISKYLVKKIFPKIKPKVIYYYYKVTMYIRVFYKVIKRYLGIK